MRISNRRSSIRGFTLVEMAISLVIAGLLTAGMLRGAVVLTENEQRNITLERLDKIEDALVLHVQRHARLPCPADARIAYATSTDGVEYRNPSSTPANQCGTSADYQAVPWRALGLAPEDTLDAWGRRIAYRPWISTTTDVTRTNSLNLANCQLSPSLPASGSGICTSGQTLSNYLNGKGWSIYIGNAASKPLVYDPAKPESGGGGAYVLLSYGMNGRGAWLRTGARMAAVTSSDSDFAARGHEAANGLMNTTTTGSFYIGATAEGSGYGFDDIVRSKNIYQLVTDAKLLPRRGV